MKKLISLIILGLVLTATALGQTYSKNGFRVGTPGNYVNVVTDSVNGNTFSNLLKDRTKVFNVLDYGAKGDGVTDDRAAIVAAIADCDTLGGIIFFPPGKYLISAKITIFKSVSLQGVPTMGWLTTAAYEYPPAGAILLSDIAGGAMIEITSASWTDGMFSTSSVKNLNFRDVAGNNDTLLVLRNKPRSSVSDCVFHGGAVGLKIDGAGDDGEWCSVLNNHFINNTTGIYLDQSTAGSLPGALISGGSFSINAGQTGLYSTATQTRITGMKMDVMGAGAIGLDIRGYGTSIFGVNIEMLGAANSTIGINSVASYVQISDLFIQGNNTTGVGIKIANGASKSNPTNHNSISNSAFTSNNIGIWVQDSTAAVKINNCSFGGTMGTAGIQLDANSGDNVITNITSKTVISGTCGIVDNGDRTTIINYVWADGGNRQTWTRLPFKVGATTDNTPSDAELTSVIGLTPAQAGNGFQTIVLDNTGSEDAYLVLSDGSNWFRIKITKIYAE